MEEKQEKEKGNFWLTVASFIVNKRKAIEILFVLAMIYSVLSINKVQVNQDITSYLPADSETRIGLSLMEEQFTTYGSAKVMVSNITYAQAEDLVDDLENIEGMKQIEFDDSKDHFTGADALFSVTFDGTEDEQISKDALEEVKETLDAEEAVKVALSKAIPEISSSSLTTISGMVAMMFMQFRLGYDMGIILVKAIILSLISVFFLMPGVLLIFAKGIDKTHHKCYVPKITFVGKFANLTKYIIPPVFIVFLVFAFWESNHCQYIYDTNSIVSAKKSESKIASEKIENTFGASNQLVVMVPKGDYDSEKKVLGKIEKLDYVNSALGLANVAINDDYMLTDKLNPRQFAELTDLDVEVVQILYTAYAYNEEQYGPVFTGIDDYEVPIIDMFLFLYDQYQEGYVTLDADLDDQLTSLYDTLHDAQLQLQGDDYSRFVLDLSLPAEGQETYDAMDEIRGIAAKYFGKDNVILVGNSTSDHDLESSFASDNIVISVLTALFVMIILFFTFQSAGLPVLLVLTIQGSIWINFAVPAMRGQTIFFIAYLIVSAIQMGATIDYAIVISSRYMDLKQRMPIKDAITESLNQAFPTIFTSGTILTCAGFLIGEIASDPTVASIGVALGRGTLISIILVLFVLPQILLFGDFIIEKTALAMNISRPQKEVAGRVRVTGHVKGYVQGEIDADVSGVFQGQMKVSLDSHIPGRHGEVTHDDTQNPMLPGMTQDENVAAETETAAKEEQEEKKS